MHKNNKTNIDDNFIALPKRANADKEINEQGRKIIDLCKTYNLAIMNGRSEGAPWHIHISKRKSMQFNNRLLHM